MSVQALGALAPRFREDTRARDDERAAVPLGRRLVWTAAAGVVLAFFAGAAASLGEHPAVVGALALGTFASAVPLLLRALATPVLARVDAALAGRDALEAELEDARRAIEEYRSLAHHDPLTGLPNRILLQDRLGVAITHAQRQAARLAVLFLDLDGFKAVNDSFGHACGDRLLVEVAQRLRGSVRAGDTVARLGGDEFVVLLTSVTGADDAALVAGKLADALGSPFRLEGRDVRTSASVGVSVYPVDGTSPDDLVRAADAAMHRHKRRQASRRRRGVFAGVA